MAAGALLITMHRSPRLSRWVAVAANLLTLASSVILVHKVREAGVLVLTFGGWEAPFGIVFAVDMFSALMVLVTMIVSTATLLFACCSLDGAREEMFFYPLFQFLLMGVNGSFLTGDLFNLFVWFEVLLISSYALMALGSEGYQLQETFKYLVLNALSSSLFLVGIALVYGATGTLNMADIATKFSSLSDTGLGGVVALIFMVVFGLKGGLFPLYMWLPRSYFGPPTVISALFGGLLTKVGVYALFRLVSLMFAAHLDFVLPLLSFVAGATMFLGVLGALSQWDFKRVLSYHIVSQIGYMIMGLALFTPVALAGAIFYIVHHILVKTSLFLVAAAVEKRRGTTHLTSLGGVMETAPVLTGLFLLAGLALAGVPPLSGFVAKFMLVQAGLDQAAFTIVTVSVVVSFLTLFSMMKIFRYAFWSPVPEREEITTGATARLVPVTLLVAAFVILGLGGGGFMPYVDMAAEQLLDPSIYIAAVLRGAR